MRAMDNDMPGSRVPDRQGEKVQNVLEKKREIQIRMSMWYGKKL